MRPIQSGLIGLALVLLFSIIARLTFLGGSLFDPIVAPGIGPFYLGDLLAMVGFGLGWLVGWWRNCRPG